MMTEKYPENLGKYRIDGVLGKGAMGIVYKGYDVAIDRYVALKTVNASLLDKEEAGEWLDRFRQEAKAVGRCLHPNIVAVFDYGEDRGIPYIAMEYVDGVTLKDHLHDKVAFKLNMVIYIISEVLTGLGYAHQNGVVHRDIKPANVMVLNNGNVKVADFGVAHLDTSELTQTGTVIGTPSYMAPEQFKGEQVAHVTDIYACGVLMYELLSGTVPFPGRTSSEVMYKVLSVEPEYEIHGRPIPTAFRKVLATAMAKEQEERFQSAAEFVAAIKQCYGENEQEDAPVDNTVLLARQEAQSQLTQPQWDETKLKLVENNLAIHLGPIAKVMVKKARRQADSMQNLCRSLCQQIPNQEEQDIFMQSVKKTF